MGDIQPGHHHRDPGLENDLCRFRVDVDIKFDRRLPVTQHHGAAHHHDAGNFAMQFRVAVEQQGDVGLRTGSDDRNRPGAFAQRFRHQLDGGAGLRGKARLRQRRAVKPTLAMHVIGDNQLPHQRLKRAAGDRNIRALKQGEHPQDVAQRFFRCLVSGGGGDGFHIEFG